MSGFIDTLPEEIKSTVPEEFASDPNVTKYATFPDFIKGHTELAKMISAKGVIIPKDTDPPESWNTVYNALGRPEKPEGYKLTELKDLHPKIKVTPESMKAFTDFAYKNGLTNKQVDGLNQWYLGLISQSLKAEDDAWNKQVETGTAALRQEWGADFDKNVTVIKELVAKRGGQALVDALGDKINNPVVMKFLAQEASKYTEDDFKKMGAGAARPGDNDALKQIEAIKANKEHAYWNEKDSKHDEAVAEMKKLYEQAYPEGGANA